MIMTAQDPSPSQRLALLKFLAEFSSGMIADPLLLRSTCGTVAVLKPLPDVEFHAFLSCAAHVRKRPNVSPNAAVWDAETFALRHELRSICKSAGYLFLPKGDAPAVCWGLTGPPRGSFPMVLPVGLFSGTLPSHPSRSNVRHLDSQSACFHHAAIPRTQALSWRFPDLRR